MPWNLSRAGGTIAPMGAMIEPDGRYEGTEASTRAWLEVACVAYLFARLRTEPT